MVTQKLRPGGELVPGIYAGNQYHEAELVRPYRVRLYASGEYRITSGKITLTLLLLPFASLR